MVVKENPDRKKKYIYIYMYIYISPNKVNAVIVTIKSCTSRRVAIFVGVGLYVFDVFWAVEMWYCKPIGLNAWLKH